MVGKDDGSLQDRVRAYEHRMMKELATHVCIGDSKVMRWDLSGAAGHYERATHIAKYHLRRTDIVDWLSGRMKYVADNYLLKEGEKGVPDLDGLDL